MRRRIGRLVALLSLCAFTVMAQAPVVKSWTIRETGAFRKIPTSTLRTRMQERGVLFRVNEAYDQHKVDGTVALLREMYKASGVVVLVTAKSVPSGPKAVKVEYTVHKQ